MDQDDRRTVLILFCVTFGVASLGLPYSFASSGPVYGSIVLYFCSYCNIAASTVLSKSMSLVPPHIRTFGDIGEFVAGYWGRFIIVCSQLVTNLLIPIVFLVICGHDLLPFITKDIAPSTTINHWIVLMALFMWPITLIPTLRETYFLAFLGAFCAVLADCIAVYTILTDVPPQHRFPDIQPLNVLYTFGKLSFAFGTGCMIPALHRQHHDPSRIPHLLTCTMLVITLLYLLVGLVVYAQYGCTSPPNILTSLPPGPAKYVASAAMVVHVIVAFGITVNPAFFIIERSLFGKDADMKVNFSSHPSEEDATLLGTSQPVKLIEDNRYQQREQSESAAQNATTEGIEPVVVDKSTDSFTGRERLLCCILRTGVLVVQTLLAVVLQSCLSDLLDVIGATSVAVSCLIAPCACFLLLRQKKILTLGDEHGSYLFPSSEVSFCYVVIVTSAVCGILSTIHASVDIAQSAESFHSLHTSKHVAGTNGTTKFPFCYAGEQN